jgi:hypothetical protein
MPLPFSQSFLTARVKPQVITDGVVTANGARGGRYGEQYVQNIIPGKQSLADEGSYYVATNPTLGTGVATTTSITTFSDTTTSGLFIISNRESPSDVNAKRIYLDYMKLLVTAVAASATVQSIAVRVQNNLRVATANSANITPVNVNNDLGSPSVCGIQAFSAGSMTMPASDPSFRTVGRSNLGGLLVLGDELVTQFGGVDMSGSATSATAGRKVSVMPPVVIGPNQCATIYFWATASAGAASFEYELTWWER